MRRSLLLVPLVVGALASPALGTLLIHLSDEDLCHRADAVVRAEVLDVESFRDRGRNRVFTNTTLGVLEYLKGHGPDQILVETAGGVIGDLEYRVLGSPHFTPGEEVVLFLEARSSANRVIGMAQGKLRVVRATSGEAVLERDLTSVALVERDAARGTNRIGSHGSAAAPLTLERLRSLLRTTIPASGTGTLRPLAPAPWSL